MNRAGRCAVACVIAALALVSWASPVSAHAELLSSEPVAESVLDAAPNEIVLTFTEPVDPTEDAVRLVDAAGTPVGIGPVTQNLGSASITAAIPDDLGEGSYVVAWSVVSADSHPIRGAFVFSVGAPSEGAGDLVGDVTGDADSSTGGWLAAGRYASFSGIAVLVGALAAAVAVAPAALRRRRFGYVLFAGGYIAVVGTIIMICAQASVIGSSFADWSAVADTRSGVWWLARLVIVAAATTLVPWRHLLQRRPVQIVAAIGSIGLFAVVAAGGHAVSGRAIGVGFTATVVHLAAMALWVGGLGLIVLVVGRGDAMATARRFSPLAFGAVVSLAVTGLVNGWRQIGSLDGITDSSYGRWLIVKLVVVAVVVGVAVVSRRVTRRDTVTYPGDLASVSAAAASPAPAEESLLRRSVLVEAVGMVVVLASTAGLTGATPPRQAGAAAVDVSVTAVQDDHYALIDVLPAVTGGTTLHVTIAPPGGSLEQADEITVSAALPDQQVGPLDIVTFPAGPNHVTTNEANFPIPGQWTLTITARYGEFDQLVFTADIAITNR